MKYICLSMLLLLGGCATIDDPVAPMFEETMLNSVSEAGCELRSLEVNQKQGKLRIICAQQAKDSWEF